MRILDRYVLRAWAGAFLASAAALVGLFLLSDFLAHLDDFFEAKDVNRLGLVLKYYGVRTPLFFVWVAPMVSLCAMMLTLTRFARTNEIVPVLVSGRSARRFLLPAFAASALVSGAMLAIDEKIAPSLAPAFRETDSAIRGRKDSDQVVLSDGQHQDWLAEKFRAATNEMEKVLVVRLSPDFHRIADIRAEKAAWKRSQDGWLLTQGVFTEYDPETQRRTSRTPLPPEGLLVPSDLRPQSIEESHEVFRMATLSQLERNIEDFPFQPFWRVQWHAKWTMPLSNLVLLLIGVPLLVRSGVRNVFVGVGITLGIGIVFFGVVLAFLDAGNSGRLDPVTAAWFPIILFGAAGTAMVDSMKT
ncbi:MAG: LptF/LptG family permease [Planctomycetia bacterium]|nr:LptF/LptG family permease [Planctomycetia bacterium]